MVYNKYVACITSYCDAQIDPNELVRMSIVVTDISKTNSPIKFSRDWWIRDMYLNDMYDEVDALIGDLTIKYKYLTKIHVDGLVPLVKVKGEYMANYITRENLIQCTKEYPDQFK